MHLDRGQFCTSRSGGACRGCDSLSDSPLTGEEARVNQSQYSTGPYALLPHCCIRDTWETRRSRPVGCVLHAFAFKDARSGLAASAVQVQACATMCTQREKHWIHCSAPIRNRAPHPTKLPALASVPTSAQLNNIRHVAVTLSALTGRRKRPRAGRACWGSRPRSLRPTARASAIERKIGRSKAPQTNGTGEDAKWTSQNE